MPAIRASLSSVRFITLALVLTGLSVGGCADGGTGGRRDGSGSEMDSSQPDGGPPDDARPMVDAPPPTDAGPGEGLECEACEAEGDCAAGSHCVPLGGGDTVCVRSCDPDLPDCAPGFDCVAELLTTTLPEPVCIPVGERCCVDLDGDHHGQGIGCDGTDCDDTSASTNPAAAEVCNGEDDDCNGTDDDGDAATLCPRDAHVASAMCVAGACDIASCEPGFDDCDSAAAGCETSTRTLTDCGSCGTPCMLAHATATCGAGTCEVATCDAGWADCNGVDADGCERELNTLTDCGGCGIACERTNALTSCTTGTCQVTGCAPTWGNCDSAATNGCETSVTTNANCGGCGMPCAPSRGTGDCSTGMCRITTCQPGWEDCDGNVANGCEVQLNTLANCGSCGATCGGANATASCSTGSCSLSCNPGFANCDGSATNGCEASLTSLAHCGGCGMLCDRANAAESCSTGACTLGACTSGYSNCDGNAVNGCELARAGTSICGGAVDLGTMDGDRSCGAICGGNTSWDLLASRTGRTSAWYRATIFEDSTCDADVEHRVTLTSPAGSDYDLYVYRSCGGTLIGSSTGTGTTDTVTVLEADDTGGNDGITYWIEVRHYNSTTCDQWTLRVEGHDC